MKALAGYGGRVVYAKTLFRSSGSNGVIYQPRWQDYVIEQGSDVAIYMDDVFCIPRERHKTSGLSRYVRNDIAK